MFTATTTTTFYYYGTIVSTTYYVVAFLISENPFTNSISDIDIECTGNLITSKVALTVGHCICSDRLPKSVKRYKVCEQTFELDSL